jgi:hypothetical protein
MLETKYSATAESKQNCSHSLAKNGAYECVIKLCMSRGTATATHSPAYIPVLLLFFGLALSVGKDSKLLFI